MQEHLAKEAAKLLTGGAGFYSSVFLVPKYLGGLWPIVNIKQFNHCMHIPAFRMPTNKIAWQLIQQGDYTFFIDIMDSFLHILIVKHHYSFLQFA